MSGAAGKDLSGRLDATVYRSQGPGTFYFSEHAFSTARGKSFGVSLDHLARQVRKDLRAGVYSSPAHRRLRTFTTLARLHLRLRNGCRSHLFPVRIDEIEDYRGRRSFEASCPTNYLHESGQTITEAAGRLEEVITARYDGESVRDLQREMLKCPIMATVDVSATPGETSQVAVITRSRGGCIARLAGSGTVVQAPEPYSALRKLEATAATTSAGETEATGEPAFCVIDVSLPLYEGLTIHRVLVSVSRHAAGETAFFQAFAPQANDACVKARTFERALNGIRDAISLEFREMPRKEAEERLKKQPILATARIVRPIIQKV